MAPWLPSKRHVQTGQTNGEEGIAMVYRSYHIRTTAQLNRETRCWIPQAVISSDKESTQQGHPITGPKDVFKSKEAAEGHALQMAKWWIDDETSVKAARPVKLS